MKFNFEVEIGNDSFVCFRAGGIYSDMYEFLNNVNCSDPLFCRSELEHSLDKDSDTVSINLDISSGASYNARHIFTETINNVLSLTTPVNSDMPNISVPSLQDSKDNDTEEDFRRERYVCNDIMPYKVVKISEDGDVLAFYRIENKSDIFNNSPNAILFYMDAYYSLFSTLFLSTVGYIDDDKRSIPILFYSTKDIECLMNLIDSERLQCVLCTSYIHCKMTYQIEKFRKSSLEEKSSVDIKDTFAIFYPNNEKK